MLVRWPGKIKPGQISNEIVQHHDWLPTFLAMAGDLDGVEKLKSGYQAIGRTYKNHIDGYNLLPYLTGEALEFLTKKIDSEKQSDKSKSRCGVSCLGLISFDAKRRKTRRRRPAGSVNKRHKVVVADTSALMPIEWMLAVLRDPEAEQSRRDQMAIQSAPYLRARLTATSVTSTIVTAGAISTLCRFTPCRVGRGSRRTERSQR